jgi:hypothetical protein
MLTPYSTYLALLIVQALHLLHHRISKRHISFAEVVSAVVLCVPPWAPLPALALMSTHIILILIQIIGSLWIKRLSPNWSK